MNLILLAFLVGGLVGWWLGHRPVPAPLALVTAAPAPVTIAPAPSGGATAVLVRYCADDGQVLGEEWIPARSRRPSRWHGGACYMAASCEQGVWMYRQVRG